MQTNIQTELQEISGKFAFSLNIWTSSVVKAYIEIIVHFINKDWQLQQKNFRFVKIEGSYTDKILANEPIKINEIMIDNTNNNNILIYYLELWAIGKDISFSTNNYFHCFVYVINLSVQAALKQLKNKIDKV
ncbi:8599_t:CDS:2 [Cetraspora pellucida]|uniref:8599_t:CDS:1 n=1 Tax=Cetraspora pellucida TaxID=1433469 RepID=A0A9N9J7M6_9GLOM|nr:8599_t:CDS:2 [Cetraspora pellucida]